jgi:hypothetical protein
VTFPNIDAGIPDVYQSEFDASEGLIGPDPTRSIEVWAYNPVVADEETILAWGHRGGPDGTNMSFNYGVNPFFGAVGHWGGAGPDIGWNDGGGAPAAGRWHHLVYTYDGAITRVYADGCIVNEANCETNAEELGAGVINTFGPSKVTLASQLEADGLTLTAGLRGTLSLAVVRIHDEVLTPAQIQNNFDVECEQYCPPPGNCTCPNCPVGDDMTFRGKARYTRQLTFGGFPAPSSLVVTQPAGATISPTGLLSYAIPNPAPASFNVRVECVNSEGTSAFSWRVVLVDRPPPSGVQTAGALLVDLDADHESAGTSMWLNNGTLADFSRLGAPALEALGATGAPGVSFNTAGPGDAYQCNEPAPAGVIGLNPTRSIEVWAFNPDVGGEETLLAWARRGGPDGSNMSFNYGTDGNFGAVGHWGGAGPDLGWGAVVPLAGEWHHLVYTYDGDATTTTRVYADGLLANSEALGPGTINTHDGSPITLAVQITNATGTLDFDPAAPRYGTLSLGKVRVHDGVLTAGQIFQNYNLERETYGAPEPPATPPAFTNVPADDTFCAAETSYSFTLQVTGAPPPDLSVLQPAGATITPSGLLTYAIPQPPAAAFVVEVRATNAVDTVTASWNVVREDLGVGLQVAEDLYVNLDAGDPTAGTANWTNDAILSDFVRVGAPQVVLKGGVKAVSFNEGGRSGDSYQSVEPAPEGVVGIDPTRTIEVWAWNDQIADEETLVAWGWRGGPAGTNMSFNYGLNGAFGAVGHWDAPDLGWGAVPAAGQWHHLVYTYDGTMTRVFDNGVQTNSEVLAPGAINTNTPSPITLAVQIVNAAGALDFGARMGTLALGRVRVHEGVLTPCQVLGNYLTEKGDFEPPPCPTSGADFADTHCTGLTVEETGSAIGATHRATASGVDDTGEPVLYTFTATNGVDTRTVGPTANNLAGFNLRALTGPFTFTVTVDDRLDCNDQAADATCRFPDGPGDPQFRRGDTDGSKAVNITDMIRILNFLFAGGPAPTCQDTADTDDSGGLNITDGIYGLNFLFAGGRPIPAPGPAACGVDPTSDALPACTYEC